MNLLRKKIYFSTLIKMGAALLFILIGIGAGIGSGTINEIGEYFRGFKVEKINSSAELMNIKKYNTKTIEVKEIYPLQIDYFDGFSKCTIIFQLKRKKLSKRRHINNNK